MVKRIVTIWIVMFFVISCKENDKENLPFKKLDKKASFFTSSDEEIFLVNPSDMFQFNNRIFIAEGDLSHLAIFDLELKLIKTVGRFGEGPDDFFYLGKIGATPEGNVFLHDRGHEILRIFDLNGNQKNIISVPESLDSENFIFQKDSICYSYINGKKPFQCYNYKGEKLLEFGEFVNSSNNDFQKYQRSMGALYPVGKSYLKILPTESEISIFDQNHVKIDSVDIFSIPIFNFYKDKVERFYTENFEKSFISVFRDYYLRDDKLYLLAYSSYLDAEDNEVVDSNKIVVLDISADRIRLDSVLDLSEEADSYSQIMVFDGFIYAFDKVNGKLDQFQIN
jgi:hypothetical protein